MAIQSLDQKIAAITHTQATTVLKLGQGAKKEVGGYIKKTASRLRVSGLGVTVTFCHKDNDLKPVADVLETCLRGLGALAPGTDVLTAYRTASAAKVRQLQTYSEQILEWLAKWADTYKTPG